MSVQYRLGAWLNELLDLLGYLGASGKCRPRLNQRRAFADTGASVKPVCRVYSDLLIFLSSISK